MLVIIQAPDNEMYFFPCDMKSLHDGTISTWKTRNQTKLEDKIRRQLLVCHGQVDVVLTLILTTDTLVGFRDFSDLHNTYMLTFMYYV